MSRTTSTSKRAALCVDIFPLDYADAVKERSQAVSTLTAEELELQASLTQRKKALAEAEANLRAAAAEESLAEKEMKRYDRLVKEEAASRSQYDPSSPAGTVAPGAQGGSRSGGRRGRRGNRGRTGRS